MVRAILHVDMDAFYASVEQRDNPQLRGLPVIVGGHPTRGVVLAASYEVRPLGVRSAMPMSRAVRLAPHARVVPPRFEAYLRASEEVFSFFEELTPLVEGLSLDEAFLDVTASQSLFGTPWEMASALRARIARELHLPASAGIASTKFVAKIASDLAKPNGQREVLASETRAFLAALPVSRLWGVGPKAQEALHARGLKTVGDVATRSPQWLERELGSLGVHLWALSQGDDERPVVPDREAKSVGAEDTFEADLPDAESIHPYLHLQALRVGRRLRRGGQQGRVVQLKLKYADFSVLTRRHTLEQPTDDDRVIYREALALLDKVPLNQPVRLTGVSVQELGGGTGQLNLFAAPEQQRRSQLNQTLDRIAAKFGSGAVVPADLAGAFKEDPDEEARRAVGASRLDPTKRPNDD